LALEFTFIGFVDTKEELYSIEFSRISIDIYQLSISKTNWIFLYNIVSAAWFIEHFLILLFIFTLLTFLFIRISMSAWKLVEAEAASPEPVRRPEPDSNNENRDHRGSRGGSRGGNRHSSSSSSNGSGRGPRPGRGKGNFPTRTKADRSYFSYLAVQQM
jgi:hypothetical protein